MRKAKKLSNKLIAILLSASMVFAPVLQSMPVYAAEPVIEEGSADTLTDNATTDEPVTDNNDSDTPAAENGDSENQGTENGDTENPGTENGDSENPGTENGDTENPGTENGDSDNSGTENGDTENPGTENGNSENPGTEDGDIENPEDPDAEDGDSEDLGDADADESQEEVQDLNFEAVEVSATTLRGQRAVNVSGFSNVGGWNESIYAEIAGIEPTDVVDVEYSGPTTGKLSTQKVHEEENKTALDYLVRKVGDDVRIDVPGLKKGTYTLTVKVGSDNTLVKKENIEVYAYDRSGYAHFNYTDGVGAYKDDGTLKDNAIVLYVTDDNRNDVTLKVGNTTVKGIGNILNSVGKECGEAGHDGQCRRVSGDKVYYGKANDNQNIITKLSEANIPLVVRFIGTVSETGLFEKGTYDASSEKTRINGLTSYASYDNGGSPDDNGHMARIQSGRNITLEGIGYDAAIDGWGFHFMSETATSPKGFGKSFEVRNLRFINTPEDAVGMEGQQSGGKITAGVERCWIHNNEFISPKITSPAEPDKSEGDGSVDFKRGQYFTCSYNYFEGCHKTNLIGSSDSSLQYNLTFHHNYWYRCKARGPLTRQANVHMYNNYVYGQTDFAQQVRANAYIFSEYNLFYASKAPQDIKDGKATSGMIKSYHDSISSSVNMKYPATVVTDKKQYLSNNCAYGDIKYDDFDINSTKSYIPDNDYQLDTDFTELRKVIVSQTGTQDRKPTLAKDVEADKYSMAVQAGVTPIQVTSLPFDYSYAKSSKIPYAFTVNAAFNIDLNYVGDEGVLVNEAGENILQGNGTLINLPMGTYMIQAGVVDPKTYPSLPEFKEVKAGSTLHIEAYEKDGHYHVYEKGELTSSVAATCTDDGSATYTYNCIGNNIEKCTQKTKPVTEVIKALGHSWSNWTTVTAATETEKGSEKRTCSRCNTEETRDIPAGGTGGGSGSGIITVAGDYVLNFEGKKVIDDSKFFTVNAGGGYSDSKGDVIVNGTTYKYSLKMASSTVTFSCNEGATLFLAFAPGNAGLEVMVGEEKKTIGPDGTITIENMPAGTYTIAKVKTDGEKNLAYVSVTNPPTEEIFYTLSFEYNYDDARDAIEVQVAAGTKYASMAELAPASFTRRNYQLKGLYTDYECEHEVSYEYVVNGDATFYADWEENYGPTEKTYSVIFNSKGGSDVATVRVTDSQIYTITEKPTRDGYAFAGWYDAEENGKLVEVVDGTKLTGSITLYAYWNKAEVVDEELSLDCSKDLNNVGTLNSKNERDITALTTVKGFKIHALAGGGGTNNESPKYYMTVKDSMLYTNGVLLTDTNIQDNDGLLKSIEFEAPGAGVLIVGVAASTNISGNDSCNIVLSKKSGSDLQVVRSYSLTNKTQSNKEFEIDAAGTYYLYATGTKGVAYSSIKFTQPTYTILYQTKGGTAEGSESVTKKAGEKITLPSTSNKPGYTFKGWLIGSSTSSVAGGTEYTVDPDDASYGVITITADYTPMIYTIEYDAKGGGIGNGGTSDDDALEYEAGTVITLKIPTPPNGYEFAGWKVVGSSDNKLYGKSYTVRAEDADDGKITFEAVYEKAKEEYTVKFVAGAGTLPAGMSDSVVRLEEEIIALGDCTPTDPDQKFIGWRVGDAGSIFNSSYTVNADDADENKVITINAVYGPKDKNTFTVTIDTSGGNLVGGGSTSITVIEGDKLPNIRCEMKGYRFVGWTVGDSEDVIDINTYIVEGNITIKAKYEEGSSHEGIAIVGLKKKYEFTGAKIIPNIAVVDYDVKGDNGEYGKVLSPGVDYTVKYANNNKLTSVSKKDSVVTVTGKGNYVGKYTEATFKIVEPEAIEATLEDLKGAKLSKINPVDYNGEAQYPEIELKLKNGTPTKYTYDEDDGVYKTAQGVAIGAKVSLSNNINKGTATILLTGKEVKGKATSVKKTFKINAIDLSKAGNKLTVDATAGTYSVKGAVPASITVKYEGTTLRKGVDYTVKYSSNKKAGVKGKIAITGKGNYAKKYTAATYDINPLVWSAEDTGDKNPIKAVQVYAGMKAVKVKATVVDNDGNTLKPSQYTLKVYKNDGNTEYTKSDPALIANDVIYVEATAKQGNTDITGTTVRTEFKVGNNIAKAKFVLNKVNGKAFTAQYTGEAIKLNPADLTVTMKGVNGKLKASPEVLDNNEEYAYEIVSYSNNINKGTATAVIKGIGSYSGTKTVKFKIVGKEMKIGEKDLPWSEITSQFKSFMNGIFN